MEENNKVVNIRTGRVVIDDSTHESWRQSYYKKLDERRDEEYERIKEAVHRRDLGKLNVLGTREVGEYFGMSQSLAWYYMSSGMIPSFRIDRRWFTNSWVVDFIETRARALVASDYTKRLYPRIVFKADNNQKW